MRKLFLLIACMVFLSGCTQSNIVQPDSETKIADPDFDVREGIEIDWTQVSTDAEEDFEDQNAVRQKLPILSGTQQKRDYADVGGGR